MSGKENFKKLWWRYSFCLWRVPFDRNRTVHFRWRGRFWLLPNPRHVIVTAGLSGHGWSQPRRAGPCPGITNSLQRFARSVPKPLGIWRDDSCLRAAFLLLTPGVSSPMRSAFALLSTRLRSRSVCCRLRKRVTSPGFQAKPKPGEIRVRPTGAATIRCVYFEI